MKMDGFPAKLVVIAALVLLLMGDFQATCETLLHHGRGKSSLWHVDCRDGLAEIHIGRKQGSFGCQVENLSKKIIKFMVLAAAVLLVLGDFAATSALIPVDGKQSTTAFVPDSKDGSRYAFSRREGCFGCQRMNINKGRQVLLRLRRLQQTRRFTRPPPPLSLIRNSFGICSTSPAPPPSLTA
ncbi:hypothetical protein ACE6H2_017942 [Prunus campanulata]